MDAPERLPHSSAAAPVENTELLARHTSDFLSRLSHEIRTPLHGILGMTDVAIRTLNEASLQEAASSIRAAGTRAEVQPLLHMVRQSAISMLNIVNDLLDISKVESGTLILEEQAFSLTQLVRETLAPLQDEALGKGLTFHLEMDAGLPSQVLGDPARLRQVLRNLVENAVKFTRAGSVTARIRLANRKRQPGMAQVAVTITDTGVGIPENKLPRVFDSFYQVDGSLSREFEGTGLGLAISRHLVKMMGGDIWVRSQPGQGSAFSFSVWLKLPPEAEAQPTSPATHDARKASSLSACDPDRQSLPPLRILLAEDNLVNQAFAQLILKREGHSVTTVSNGNEALTALASARYDLVLMDVRMPELDGVETTRRIRAREDGVLEPDVPIIAMTAHSQRGDRERFLEIGMDAYISKPMAWDSVIETIGGVLRRRGVL